MTVQLASHLAHGKSKKVLQDALNADAGQVKFHDPSPFEGSRGTFYGKSIPFGESFAVVMDPQTRRRFALVKRRSDGQFRVE